MKIQDRKWKVSAATAVSCLALTLSACGNSSGSSADVDEGQASAGVAAAKAELAKYSASPVYADQGPPFDATKNAGKTVFNINGISSNQFFQAATVGVRQAADAVGVKVVDFKNSGTVSEWVQGMNLAISQKASAIILNGQDPSMLAPQIAAAKAAGIPVFAEHLYFKGQELTAGITGTAFAPLIEASELLANAVIVATNGKANVLGVFADDVLPSPPQQRAMEKVFKENCPACKVKMVSAPSSQWATKVAPEVTSALTADPTINYVIPIYDSMAQYAVSAIIAKGMKDKVAVATYNGTPAVLDFLQKGNVVAIEIAENPAWIGWATMDQVLRVMAGHPVTPDAVTPLRVITKDNIAETGTPPELGKGVGDGYVEGYKKLWNVAS